MQRGARFMRSTCEFMTHLPRPGVTDNRLASVIHCHVLDDDQLATALGQAGWFDIRDTSASFADSLHGLPPSEVARRLNAGHLVGGALEISGPALRLRLRLINPGDESQVWAEDLTGTRDGIFELQDRMARRVLGQIEP